MLSCFNNWEFGFNQALGLWIGQGIFYLLSDLHDLATCEGQAQPVCRNLMGFLTHTVYVTKVQGSVWEVIFVQFVLQGKNNWRQFLYNYEKIFEFILGFIQMQIQLQTHNLKIIWTYLRTGIIFPCSGVNGSLRWFAKNVNKRIIIKYQSGTIGILCARILLLHTTQLSLPLCT